MIHFVLSHSVSIFITLYCTKSLKLLHPLVFTMRAGCIALNTAFFLWYHVGSRASLSHYLNYFLLSPAHVAYTGVPAQLLLSAFAHLGLLHLFVNISVLHSFTPLLANSLGPRQAAFLYVSGGLLNRYRFRNFFSITMRYLVGNLYII